MMRLTGRDRCRTTKTGEDDKHVLSAVEDFALQTLVALLPFSPWCRYCPHNPPPGLLGFVRNEEILKTAKYLSSPPPPPTPPSLFATARPGESSTTPSLCSKRRARRR